jgi:transposase
MLVVSELGEALEAIRDNNWSHHPKSGGVGEEIADAQIRLADLFTDLFPPDSNDAVVRAKMEYNASRPRKHGRSL